MSQRSQVVHLRSARIVNKQASEWLVKMDSGPLSREDHRALKEWLNQSPDHGVALKQRATLWSELDDFFFQSSIEPSSSTDPEVQRSSAAANWVAVAASFILCACVGWYYWSGYDVMLDSAAGSHYVTEVGARKTQTLADGTIAHLNTDTIIEVNYSKDYRAIKLLRGEALFDVAHNPERPFVVHVSDRVVKALGTKFVVRLDSDNILVTVTDGKIQLSKLDITDNDEVTKTNNTEISQRENSLVVSKGQEVAVDIETDEIVELKVSERVIADKLAWMDGYLVFKEERLDKVIAEVGRYTRDRVVITDPEISGLRISGRFSVSDTEALLEAIDVSFGVKVGKTENGVFYLSK